MSTGEHSVSRARPAGSPPACRPRPTRALATTASPFPLCSVEWTSRRQTTLIVLPAFNEGGTASGATLGRLRVTPWPAHPPGRDSSSATTTTRPTVPPGRRPGPPAPGSSSRPVNQRISRARNAGARAARGRFLVFVDADTLVPRAPPCTRPRRRSSLGRACGGGAAVRMDGVTGGVAEPDGLALERRLELRRRLAAGSFVFVLREAFEAVGGFSERVYASEEIWLLPRAQSLGAAARAALRDPARPPGRHQRPQARLWYPAPVAPWRVMVGFLLLPFFVRSRRYCWLWVPAPRPARDGRLDRRRRREPREYVSPAREPAGRAFPDLLD